MHHWAVHFIFRHFVTNWNFFWTLRFLCGFPWAKKWAHANFYVFLMSEWQSNSKKQVLNDCTAFCSLQSTSSASFGCCIYGDSSGEERRRCFNSLCILKATKLVLWLYRLKSQSSKKSKTNLFTFAYMGDYGRHRAKHWQSQRRSGDSKKPPWKPHPHPTTQ